MLEYGYTDYTMYIGEHLGNPERERIRQLGLEEASEEVFEHPNNLLLYADTSYKSMQTPCTDLLRCSGITSPAPSVFPTNNLPIWTDVPA